LRGGAVPADIDGRAAQDGIGAALAADKGKETSMRILCVLTLLAAMSPAWAASPGSKEEQAACRPDVRRLCGKIGKGDDQKYRDCLQSHFQELSQKCQQVLMNHPNP
jgi:hypothetical protein